MTEPLILIVDDNPDEFIITEMILSDLRPGLRMHGVDTGEGALAYLDSGELPAFVLVDLKLPGINGLEVLRRIRASERLQCLPVVIFSSSTLPSDAEAALMCGADAFLHKGLDIVRYRTELKGLLERSL